jgi:hypothetical protein
MRRRGRAAVLTAVLIAQGVLVTPAGAAEEEPRITVLAGGLEQPRGVTTDADGAVYVAEVGPAATDDGFCFEEEFEGETEEVCVDTTSRITRVAPDGTVDNEAVTGIASLSFNGEAAIGAADVAFGPDGTMYVAVALGESALLRDEVAEDFAPAAMFGTVQRVTEDGGLELVADIAQWEFDNNPDGEEEGTGGPDSNPNGLHVTEDAIYVADAGGNTLLEVDPETGEIELAAVVEAREADMPEEFGGGQTMMQSVPTSVTGSPDGDIVFSELTGFPFPPGEANVYRVTEDPEAPEVVEGGFSAGMSVGYRGAELFVLEFAHKGLLAAEMEGDIAGGLVRVREDGTRATLLKHVLQLPGGLAVGDDGTMFMSNGAVFAGGGQLLAFDASGPGDPAIDLACPPGAVLPSAFPDIAGSVHEEAIVCTNWHGLFTGFEDGTFGPQLAITRAQFATTVDRLLRAAGADLPEGDDGEFPDVPSSHTHAGAIASLSEIEVITGFQDGTFRPGARISRDQAASMIVRAYEWLTDSQLASGPDAFRDDDGSVHEPAINAAANAGWIRGVSEDRFAPRRDITRAQVSSVLARVASTLVAEDLLGLPE